MTDFVRNCKLCNHPDRAALESALALGTPLTQIAERMGVSTPSVWRHWHQHVSPETKAAKTSAALAPGIDLEKLVMTESRGILHQLAVIRNGLFRLFERALEETDHRSAAALSARLHENLGTVAKLTGDIAPAIKTSIVNIAASPDYVALRLDLIRALAPFPDARRAVAAVFASREGAVLAAASGQPAPMIEAEATHV